MVIHFFIVSTLSSIFVDTIAHLELAEGIHAHGICRSVKLVLHPVKLLEISTVIKSIESYISNNGLLVRAITDILFYTGLIGTVIEIN